MFSVKFLYKLSDSSTYNSLSMDYKITNRKKIGEYKNIIKAGGGDCFSNRYYSYLERYNLKCKDIYKFSSKCSIILSFSF